jgi:hypothetical protein
MSDSDSVTSDSIGSYKVEDEPIFNVLSQFLVSDEDKNIATVLNDICQQLKEMNATLRSIGKKE